MEPLQEIPTKLNNLEEAEAEKKIETFSSFEEALPAIERLLALNKHKWQLKIISSLEWEDIAQIVRIHLFNKWHLYNPKRNFSPWANTIINNQLKNIRRNVYDFCSRPCLKCSYNLGGDLCGWSKDEKQNSSCPIYRKWEKSKKHAHNVTLPVSTENHTNEIMEMPSQNIDSERYILIFHDEMKKKLKPSLWMCYEHLFVNNNSEESLAEKLGFKSTQINRRPGYARIQQIKRAILIVAREVKDKIDFF